MARTCIHGGKVPFQVRTLFVAGYTVSLTVYMAFLDQSIPRCFATSKRIEVWTTQWCKEGCRRTARETSIVHAHRMLYCFRTSHIVSVSVFIYPNDSALFQSVDRLFDIHISLPYFSRVLHILSHTHVVLFLICLSIFALSGTCILQPPASGILSRTINNIEH